VQARTQLMGLLTLYGKLEEVKVCDKVEEARDKFIAEMEPKYGHLCSLIPVGSVKEAVEGADIVVTATPSRKPIVMNDWVEEGMHLTCIGADAPGKEEVDPAVLKRAKIVIDDWDQASHSGEIKNVPFSKGVITKRDVWAEIGEVVAGLKPGRTSPDEITLFTSTGLAIQDAVTANIAYKKALEKGVGKSIELV